MKDAKLQGTDLEIVALPLHVDTWG